MRNKSLLHLSFHSVIYTLAFALSRLAGALLLAKIEERILADELAGWLAG